MFANTAEPTDVAVLSNVVNAPVALKLLQMLGSFRGVASVQGFQDVAMLNPWLAGNFLVLSSHDWQFCAGSSFEASFKLCSDGPAYSCSFEWLYNYSAKCVQFCLL